MLLSFARVLISIVPYCSISQTQQMTEIIQFTVMTASNEWLQWGLLHWGHDGTCPHTLGTVPLQWHKILEALTQSECFLVGPYMHLEATHLFMLENLVLWSIQIHVAYLLHCKMLNNVHFFNLSSGRDFKYSSTLGLAAIFKLRGNSVLSWLVILNLLLTGLSAIFWTWSNDSSIYRMLVQRAGRCVYHSNNVTGSLLMIMISV